MKIVANNLGELYLMSAFLSNSIIYKYIFKNGILICESAINVLNQKFLGKIFIHNILNMPNIQHNNIEYLETISLNKNKQIELTTNSQILKLTIDDISMKFSYNMDQIC